MIYTGEIVNKKFWLENSEIRIKKELDGLNGNLIKQKPILKVNGVGMMDIKHLLQNGMGKEEYDF